MTAHDAGGLLDVDTWYDGGRAVVEVIGDIDVYTSAKLRLALDGLCAPGRYRVVVEMSQLDFLDSTGLGILVGAMKRARDGGGALALAGASERVLRVLRITGLVRVMVPFATLEEAFDYIDKQVRDAMT